MQEMSSNSHIYHNNECSMFVVRGRTHAGALSSAFTELSSPDAACVDSPS